MSYPSFEGYSFLRTKRDRAQLPVLEGESNGNSGEFKQRREKTEMGTVGNPRRLWWAATLVGAAFMLVGVPLGASANPDIDGFELDGNAVVDTSGKADWNGLPGGSLFFTGFRTDPTDDTDTGYASGLTKDTADISEWTWENADVTPAKSDIVSDYAAVFEEDGNLILYFGQNRQLDEQGDANVGFWFLQNEIGRAHV